MKNFNEKIIWENSFPNALKLLRVMKLTVFLILISVFCIFAGESYSQTKKLTLKMNNTKVEDVLATIEKQSEFYFFIYSEKVIDVERKVSIDIKNKNIQTVLNTVFEGTNVAYSIDDRLIILSTSELISNKAQAVWQQATVSGKVTDAGGQPLPGVSIVIKGTTQGTVTNADGEYTLTNVSPDATLAFSFVGMRTQEIVVGNQTTINVTMEEDVIGIEEVVAIGYGTMERNKVSTAISTVEPEKIRDQLTNSIDNTLEGKVAGVSIKQNSGAPGGGSTIRIRGSGSIGAGDDPLVVIDGIPIQSIYGKERSPLTLIDQNDIESIEILKDVSATSIYGSRGSNGVILITTKSGKVGKTDITFDIRGGFQQIMPMERLDLMNAEEFARWRLENAQEYANFYGEEFNIEDVAEEYRNPEFWRGKGTDWQDVMTRIAPQQSYNLSVSHGTEDFMGYFSIGYIHDEGAVVESNFKRLNFRANMDYEPNDFFKFGLNVNPTIRWWGNPIGGGRGSKYGNAIMVPPLDGPYFDDVPNEQEEFFDGIWDTNIHSDGTFNFINSLYDLKHHVLNDQSFNLNAQPYIQITPLEGLDFKSQLNMQWGQSFNEYFKPSTVNTGWATPPTQITGSYSTGKSFNWQFENTLNYERTFEKHSVSGLAGYTMEHYNYYGSSLNGRDFPGDDIKTLNAAKEYTGSTSESNWSMLSTIFRLSYDYDVKYLFTGTIRRDGSSRFGSERRWGYFPSASVGWNITKEDFFPTTDWLTNFKIRASYGFSGNNDIGNYTWIPTLYTNNYAFGGSVASGKSVGAVENVDLGWEKSKEFNTGLDMTLFEGRLYFIVDYYNKTTENMLWNFAIPISSGFSSTIKNIGEIRNRGVEFAVSSENISNNNFTWDTDFNISFNQNEVLDLGGLDNIQRGGNGGMSAPTITQVGYPMAMFYAWKSLGVLKDQNEADTYATVPGQLPGTPHFYDADGSGIIDQEDKIIIGNPHPVFRGGLNNRFVYKNWDLNISTSFAYKFDVYASLEASTLNLDGVFNVTREVMERWRSPEEPGNGRIAATFHQTYLDRDLGNSDHVYKDISFLKIQNLNLGYSFDLNSFKQMRVSLSIQNPYIFTNYKYGNPDVSDYGNSSLQLNADSYDYPLTQSVELGISMTL